ncbi:DUF6525 family protein [Primorskyibacter sp. 2E107]|uniref:DUF6525 family protein n=1 Tax=Primorskyibacter sp. 2E107 TaxID=3403458 RepID=UPI003AF46E4A
MSRTSNIGATRLRRRRRSEDPMRAYDRLPAPLRAWLSQAVLPWSPASCLHIWRRAHAEGASLESIIERLERAERQTLSRGGHSAPADSSPSR